MQRQVMNFLKWGLTGEKKCFHNDIKILCFALWCVWFSNIRNENVMITYSEKIASYDFIGTAEHFYCWTCRQAPEILLIVVTAADLP
jgi:hypothetical protein